jgi:predicted RNA-binding protein YlxR (DUF448 family)
MKRGHRPQRTCVGCRRTRPKPSLLRIASIGQGTGQFDAGQSAPGRGVYLCPSLDCYRRVMKQGRFRAYSNQEDLVRSIQSAIQAANSTIAEKRY